MLSDWRFSYFRPWCQGTVLVLTLDRFFTFLDFWLLLCAHFYMFLLVAEGQSWKMFTRVAPQLDLSDFLSETKPVPKSGNWFKAAFILIRCCKQPVSPVPNCSLCRINNNGKKATLRSSNSPLPLKQWASSVKKYNHSQFWKTLSFVFEKQTFIDIEANSATKDVKCEWQSIYLRMTLHLAFSNGDNVKWCSFYYIESDALGNETMYQERLIFHICVCTSARKKFGRKLT